MSRTLEAVFTKPLRLLVIIALLPIIAVGIAYFLPRSYEATANLWALHRYEIIGATGPESDLTATPADTQTTTLTELLQTRDFALEVAKATQLPTTYSSDIRSNPQLLNDTLYDEISKHVLVASQGYNLFSISYTNKDPKVAQEVVAAVIHFYGLQSQSISVTEGERLLASYQTQLIQAQQTADKAAAAEQRYLAAHPSLVNEILKSNPQYGELSDPQYAQLHEATLQAQAVVQNIQNSIATVNQSISAQGSNSDGLFKIFDAPTVPTKAVSRVRLFLIAGGIGLGVALLGCALYLLIVVRRDRAIYTESDLLTITSYPVILQLPGLERSASTLLLKQSL